MTLYELPEIRKTATETERRSYLDVLSHLGSKTNSWAHVLHLATQRKLLPKKLIQAHTTL